MRRLLDALAAYVIRWARAVDDCLADLDTEGDDL